jgi:hypothetical protein
MTIIKDPVEAGAIELTRIKGLDWNLIKEEWRVEQRKQARAVLSAASGADAGEYEHTYPSEMERLV